MSTAIVKGNYAKVRSRHWIISRVQAANVVPLSGVTKKIKQHTVSLTSIEDEGLGDTLDVVWELEPGAEIIEKHGFPESPQFDRPEVLDSFIDAVAWSGTSVADENRIQSPFRAGIEIEEYQLTPVLRAVKMPRVSLLVADDVGLGKTIESGLVALELAIRQRAKRMLIVCPSSLQIQWQEQMREKFGLEFRIVNRERVTELHRQRGYNVNPWTHFPRLIVSLDYIKREEVLRSFTDIGPATFPRQFDLLILDEAHNAAPSGSAAYVKSSLRTQAMRALVPYFEHKLFLTATPHNGHSVSFQALLELLDDLRFSRGVDVNQQKEQLELVMIRRMKSQIKLPNSNEPKFPPVKTEAITVKYTAEEERLHDLLHEYTTLRIQSAGKRRMAVEFVLTTLKKRLFSSPLAFANTVRKHAEYVEARKASSRTIEPIKEILQPDLDFATDAEAEDQTNAGLEHSAAAMPEMQGPEAALLKNLVKLAEHHQGQKDTKAKALMSWLKTHIPKDSDERVVIFTEYRDTLKYLLSMLSAEEKSGRLRVMTGDMDVEDKDKIKKIFQRPANETNFRILLATDTASEGLDLQRQCSRLIHYDIPWNPNRIEQRNGRVARYGQPASIVNIYHFASKEVEDLDLLYDPDHKNNFANDLYFLGVILKKVTQIEADLGTVGPTLADEISRKMRGEQGKPDAVKRSEATSKGLSGLLSYDSDDELADLVANFKEMRTNLHLEPKHVQRVVETALKLEGKTPLVVKGQCEGEPTFDIPVYDGVWETCRHGLEHPTREGEFRRITFSPQAAAKNHDLVLAHLNHPIVQLSTGLLRAQIWSKSENAQVHRFSARIVPDEALSQPIVVGLSRMIVVGGAKAKLHEEIVKGALTLDTTHKPLDVETIQRALNAASDEMPAPSAQDWLRTQWETLRPLLEVELKSRVEARSTSINETLESRRASEAAKIKEALQELKREKSKELERMALREKDLAKGQLTMFGDDDENREWRRTREKLTQDVNDTANRIKAEVQNIADKFKDPKAMDFPLAALFLIPESMREGI